MKDKGGGALSYNYPTRFKDFLNLTVCRLKWQKIAERHNQQASRPFIEIRGHCMGRSMGRQLNRLSAKTVSSKREAGYYCDGGGLYLRVFAVGQQDMDIPLSLSPHAQVAGHGVGASPFRRVARSPEKGRGAP